jgi:hypothetical protein
VLLAAGSICGSWDGRRDRVHLFELQLAELPQLHLDNREVIVIIFGLSSAVRVIRQTLHEMRGIGIPRGLPAE